MDTTNKEERINNVLEFVGLHKNERIIYLDLLKNGASTAVDISKRTKIHRPNTYDALRKLIDRGFISQTRTSVKNFFQAMDSEKIKSYVEQKKQEIDAVIPFIKEFSKTAEQKEDIQIAKGQFAARAALKDLLSIGEKIDVFGASTNAIDTFGTEFLKEFHAERIKKKIVMRHVYNEEAMERINKLNKMPYTEAKYLSKNYDTYVATIICGDTVVLIIFGMPASIITIKQAEIADAYKKYFELIFSKAKNP